MSKLSRSALRHLVHRALVARVRLLLGQSGFGPLLAEQEQVSLALARGAGAWHGKGGAQAMAQTVIDAFELDPFYYAASDLDFLISEGLASAGTALADALRGHEADDRKTWQAQVVPQLDRVALFVVSVFEGRWPEQCQRQPLSQWLRQSA